MDNLDKKNIIIIHREQVEGYLAGYIFQLSIQLQLQYNQQWSDIYNSFDKIKNLRLKIKNESQQQQIMKLKYDPKWDQIKPAIKQIKLNQSGSQQKQLKTDTLKNKFVDLPNIFESQVFFRRLRHKDIQLQNEIQNILTQESIVIFLGISPIDFIQQISQKVKKVFVIDHEENTFIDLENKQSINNLFWIINQQQSSSNISKDFCDKFFEFSRLFKDFLDIPPFQKYENLEKHLQLVDDFELQLARYNSTPQQLQYIVHMQLNFKQHIYDIEDQKRDKNRQFIQYIVQIHPLIFIKKGKKTLNNMHIEKIIQHKIEFEINNKKCIGIIFEEKTIKNELAKRILKYIGRQQSADEPLVLIIKHKEQLSKVLKGIGKEQQQIIQQKEQQINQEQQQQDEEVKQQQQQFVDQDIEYNDQEEERKNKLEYIDINQVIKEGFKISIRTQKNSSINCKEIAKQFGGDGYKDAAGFYITNNQLFEMCSNTKKLEQELKRNLIQSQEQLTEIEQIQIQKKISRIYLKDFAYRWQVIEQNLDGHEQNVSEVLKKLGKGTYNEYITQTICGEKLYKQFVQQQAFYKDILKPNYFQKFKKPPLNKDFINLQDLNEFYEKKGINIQQQREDKFKNVQVQQEFDIKLSKTYQDKLKDGKLKISLDNIGKLIKEHSKEFKNFTKEFMKSIYAKIMLKSRKQDTQQQQQNLLQKDIDHKRYILHNKKIYFQSNIIKESVTNRAIKERLALDKLDEECKQFEVRKSEKCRYQSGILELQILFFLANDYYLNLKEKDIKTETYYEKIIFLEKLLLKFQNQKGYSIVDRQQIDKISQTFLKDIYSYFCFLKERIKFSYSNLILKFPKLCIFTKYDKEIQFTKIEPYPSQVNMIQLLRQLMHKISKSDDNQTGYLLFYKSMIGSGKIIFIQLNISQIGKTSLTVAIASLIDSIREKQDAQNDQNDLLNNKPFQVIYATQNSSVQLQVARAAYNMNISFGLLVKYKGRPLTINQNLFKNVQYPVLLISDLESAKLQLQEQNQDFIVMVDECVMDADQEYSKVVRLTTEILSYAPTITILTSATFPEQKYLKTLMELWSKNYYNTEVYEETSKEFQTGIELRDFNQNLISPLIFCQTVQDLKIMIQVLDKNAFLDRLISANVVSELIEKVNSLNLAKKFSFDDLKDITQTNIQQLGRNIVQLLIENNDDQLVKTICYKQLEFRKQDENLFIKQCFNECAYLFTDGCLIVQDDTTQFLRNRLIKEYLLQDKDDKKDPRVMMVYEFFKKLKLFNKQLKDYQDFIEKEIQKILDNNTDQKRIDVLTAELYLNNPRINIDINLQKEEKQLILNSKEHFEQFNKSQDRGLCPQKRFVSDEEFLFFYDQIEEQYNELSQGDQNSKKILKKRFDYKYQIHDKLLRLLPRIGVGMYCQDYSEHFISQIMKIQYENRLSFLVADDSISYGVNTKISSIIIDDDMIKDKSYNSLIQLMGRTSRVGQSWKGVIYCGQATFDKIKQQLLNINQQIPIEAQKLEKYAQEFLEDDQQIEQ